LFRFFVSIARTLKLLAIFAYAAIELIVKRPSTRPQRAQWLHQFAARATRQMRLAVRQLGPYPARGAIISNHLGYLDIVAFAALHPCIFVSKSEVRRWPILGWMTTTAGTVYVERGRAGSALSAGSAIQTAAGEGLPVVFFPEGTTTKGETIRKFHSGLLSQAVATNLPITAAHIAYRLTRNNGPHITAVNTVCFWDDTPLLVHIFRLLAVRGIEVEVCFADSPIDFSNSGTNRKQAATEARAAVIRLRPAAQPDPDMP
jgi:1-acyl-sn-glycerol-3-phosphate acyltransferase